MSVTTFNFKNPKKSLNPYFDYAWKMICEREKVQLANGSTNKV